MDFLGKLDPNVTALLITAGTALVTWLYHKANGDQTASFGSVITGVVDNAIHDAGVLADSKSDAVIALVENDLWLGLVKIGVPRNAVTELLAHKAVQQGVAAAIQAAKDHARNVELQITANLAAAQAGVPAMVKGFAELAANGAREAESYKAMLVRTAPDPAPTVLVSGNPTIVVAP